MTSQTYSPASQKLNVYKPMLAYETGNINICELNKLNACESGNLNARKINKDLQNSRVRPHPLAQKRSSHKPNTTQSDIIGRNKLELAVCKNKKQAALYENGELKHVFENNKKTSITEILDLLNIPYVHAIKLSEEQTTNENLGMFIVGNKKPEFVLTQRYIEQTPENFRYNKNMFPIEEQLFFDNIYIYSTYLESNIYGIFFNILKTLKNNPQAKWYVKNQTELNIYIFEYDTDTLEQYPKQLETLKTNIKTIQNNVFGQSF